MLIFCRLDGDTDCPCSCIDDVKCFQSLLHSLKMSIYGFNKDIYGTQIRYLHVNAAIRLMCGFQDFDKKTAFNIYGVLLTT